VELNPEALAAQLVEHLEAGRKIEAIKLLREAKRYGLREAKLLIEQLQESMAANPDAARSVSESFVRTLPAPEPVDARGGLGCTLVILLLVAGIAFIIWKFTSLLR
jgi:hypothetical protein